MEDQSIIDHNRKKIYEKLDYLSEPPGYKAEVSWIVQNQIAATNGVHYIDRIGKLNTYPYYELPVPQTVGQKIMLDIGSGWGRWLISGHRKGYIPVGVDIRLEFCETQQETLKFHQVKGYSVVGDLENLPFQSCIFDLIWSFSVIQHTHIDRLTNCLKAIDNMLTSSGYTYLEFPNKNGLRNRFGPAKHQDAYKDDYNSWDVRYYSPQEYKLIFEKYLSSFSYTNHSFLGIGVLKEDLKYVSLKNKLLCSLSLLLSSMTHVVPGMKSLSDSLYIKAFKKSNSIENSGRNQFVKNHQSVIFNNLDIVPLLKCPKYGGSLVLSYDKKKLLSEEAGIYYQVVNDIPILISSEANSI